ncbi:hypothetical protein CANINC_001714 [Pichia inconspicua]|uniref:Uncharacterized protein n=1 Tax=Pichia inconspicua TaxID=52247 RepID=A0A4T0X2Z8_9ASCO|nr:hypothetical protein CANINC_001714 [[Candida] inconspicua]
MYLPNLIPTDLHVEWANPSTNPSQQNKINKGNTGLLNNRRSEFPPLSYYVPSKPIPLHTTSSSKKIYSSLKRYRNNLNTQGNADFEGLEHISLELGSRINSLNEIERWGYKWIKPLGVNKTMSELIEECRKDELNKVDGSIDPHVESNHDALNSPEEVHDDTQNNTHLMTENFGHLQPGEDINDNITSLNNNITTGTTNQTELEMDRNILIDEIAAERDLDAELSNHDLDESSSDLSDSNEYDDAFYGDGDDMNGLEDEEADSDDNVDEHHHHDSANIAVYDISTDPVDNNDEPNDRNIRSSFDHGLINILDVNKRIVPTVPDEYFMAYEDYQEDHSILEGQPRNVSGNSRMVSISESTHSRRLFRSDRQNLDSGNLTTPSTLRSVTIQQTTGNTSIDERNVVYTSDFDMTLE